MVRRYGLRDDQWEQREHVLPGREATVGVTAKDTRLFGEAVMYRYRAGIPWRDLPERFGDGKTHHRRHRRGSESRYGKEGLRLWRRMPTTKTPDRLHECPGPPAQRQRKRGGRETECLGRRKGGLTTNLHAAGDALGNPTGFHLTPGRVNDPEGADALLPHLLASMQAFLLPLQLRPPSRQGPERTAEGGERATESTEPIERGTAKRRVGLGVSILKGETSVAEAARPTD